MDDIKYLIKNLYNLYEIPMRCFFSQDEVYQPSIEFQDADPFILDISLRESLIKKWHGVPFLEQEDNHIIYGVCCNGGGITCIVGPVALKGLDGNELYQYKSRHGLLNHNSFKIYNGNIAKTASVLALLHQAMNHEKIEYNQIINSLVFKHGDKEVTEKEIYNYIFHKSEQNMDHISYATEKAIMSAVSHGDLAALKTLTNPNMFEHVGVMAKKPFKQLEYTIIAGITLFARAAIDGGANPDEVYHIADLYKQKIALCQDILELTTLYNNIKVDFCTCVQLAKAQKHELKYLEQCKRYIARHLYQHFSLDDIANEIGINKCYLTNQFTKQEGKTLKNYIHEERIRAAKNMLKYSEEPIPVIASYLCFNSQSHFGSIFKKITGTTPSAYRIKKQTADFHSHEKI